MAEDYQSDLQVAQQEQEAWLEKRLPACLTCQRAPLSRRLHPRPWAEGELLPRRLLTCPCGFEYDPYSGVILRTGNPVKVMTGAGLR